MSQLIDSEETGAAVRPKFLVDVNVGRLARWLRILGYDASFIPHADDLKLVEVALREGRVLLTKDRHILERRVIATGRLRAILVRGDDVMTQLRQVTEEMELDQRNAFSLCVECDVPLRSRPKETLAGAVPPYVFQTQQSFMACPACGKVFWQGTHWSHMKERLAGLLPAVQGDSG